MIKAYCDFCKKELNNPDFFFECRIVETKDVFDVTSKNLNPKKQPMNTTLHSCQDCYEKNIKKLIK
jgi:hypothetical protein